MYYAYDTEGCAYAQDIRFFKEKKKNLRGFIDEAADWKTIKRIAGRYVYETQRQIDFAYDREYFEREGYSEFDPDEYDEYWGEEEDYFPYDDEDWDDEEDW